MISAKEARELTTSQKSRLLEIEMLIKEATVRGKRSTYVCGSLSDEDLESLRYYGYGVTHFSDIYKISWL